MNTKHSPNGFITSSLVLLSLLGVSLVVTTFVSIQKSSQDIRNRAAESVYPSSSPTNIALRTTVPLSPTNAAITIPTPTSTEQFYGFRTYTDLVNQENCYCKDASGNNYLCRDQNLCKQASNTPTDIQPTATPRIPVVDRSIFPPTPTVVGYRNFEDLTNQVHCKCRALDGTLKDCDARFCSGGIPTVNPTLAALVFVTNTPRPSPRVTNTITLLREITSTPRPSATINPTITALRFVTNTPRPSPRVTNTITVLRGITSTPRVNRTPTINPTIAAFQFVTNTPRAGFGAINQSSPTPQLTRVPVAPIDDIPDVPRTPPRSTPRPTTIPSPTPNPNALIAFLNSIPFIRDALVTPTASPNNAFGEMPTSLFPSPRVTIRPLPTTAPGYGTEFGQWIGSVLGNPTPTPPTQANLFPAGSGCTSSSQCSTGYCGPAGGGRYSCQGASGPLVLISAGRSCTDSVGCTCTVNNVRYSIAPQGTCPRAPISTGTTPAPTPDPRFDPIQYSDLIRNKEVNVFEIDPSTHFFQVVQVTDYNSTGMNITDVCSQIPNSSVCFNGDFAYDDESLTLIHGSYYANGAWHHPTEPQYLGDIRPNDHQSHTIICTQEGCHLETYCENRPSNISDAACTDNGLVYPRNNEPMPVEENTNVTAAWSGWPVAMVDGEYAECTGACRNYSDDVMPRNVQGITADNKVVVLNYEGNLLTDDSPNGHLRIAIEQYNRDNPEAPIQDVMNVDSGDSTRVQYRDDNGNISKGHENASDVRLGQIIVVGTQTPPVEVTPSPTASPNIFLKALNSLGL